VAHVSTSRGAWTRTRSTTSGQRRDRLRSGRVIEQPAPPQGGHHPFYYSADAPQNSVKVAGVGVTATVTADDGQFLTVDVANPAAQPTP
jgi:CO/xanthine dehydrogenase FAD-binding subunit